MAAGGDAIARMADGRVAFVRGALPNELVAIEVVQSKKDFVRAEVVDVIEPAAYRVDPPCPAHAAGCGGCTWQHVDAAAQLELKTAVVIEALKRTGKLIDPAVDRRRVGAAVGLSHDACALRRRADRLGSSRTALARRRRARRLSGQPSAAGGAARRHPRPRAGRGQPAGRCGDRGAVGVGRRWGRGAAGRAVRCRCRTRRGGARGHRRQFDCRSARLRSSNPGPPRPSCLLAAVREASGAIVRCAHRHRRVRGRRAVRLGRRRRAM